VDPRHTPALGVGRGDALSFALKPSLGKPDTLTIGRNHTNDIVINDATVSRQHALLRALPAGWAIELGKGVKSLTRLSEVDLRPGDPIQLKNGGQLRLGDVRLTYYDLQGLLRRLRS
jgi:pSer/pThr/pTyr-binding forkhead associated (FHA) protein